MSKEHLGKYTYLPTIRDRLLYLSIDQVREGFPPGTCVELNESLLLKDIDAQIDIIVEFINELKSNLVGWGSSKDKELFKQRIFAMDLIIKKLTEGVHDKIE